MYSHVLVPLDGSDRALAALGPARRLARLHDAQLRVVTVATPDTTAEEIEAIVAIGRQAAGAAVPEAIVLRGTDAASELARLDRDSPQSLLCLTTRARRPLGRMLFGSVAGELVRQSTKAAVLVGPSCDVADTTAIRRLVVCLDGTPAGETILPWAARWNLATGVPLVLVRVVYPLVDAAARIPPTEEQLDDLGYVRRLALRLGQAGHRVADVTVQHASASDALVDLAAGIPGTLLAVSTAAAEPLEGSTAGQLVRSSSVPVLVASRA